MPDAEIHFLTKEAYRPVLEANPYIDKLWFLDKSILQTVARLKSLRFDAIIDLHHNLRTLLLKSGLRAPSVSFRKLNIEKYLHVRFGMNTLPPIHIVDRYMETISKFGIKNDGKGLDYFIPVETRDVMIDLPSVYDGGYVGIVVGALKATKRMPPEMLRSLCEKIMYPIVLLGGADESEEGSRIASINPEKIFNACGKYTLNESALLIRSATIIISPDTGLMHIAAAFQKPLISVWGNTIPAFGMYPYMPGKERNSFISEVKGLKCRPCSKIGYDSCPKKHFDCMMQQDENKILSEVGKAFSAGV